MSGTVIRLPEEIADELIEDGVGEPVFGTRGTATDVLSIAVDSINTGSALVAVAAGAATCRRIVRGLERVPWIFTAWGGRHGLCLIVMT